MQARQGVYPTVPGTAYHQDISQLQCLDSLLTFVNYLSARLETVSLAVRCGIDAG